MADAEATQPINIQIFMQPGGADTERAEYEQPAVAKPDAVAARPKSCLCQCGSQTGSGGGG